MTLAAEFVLTKPAIRIPERLARPSLLDYLPPKTTRSLIHILGTLDLMAAALGSSGEVQAAPLQPALNPDHVAHYFDPSLPVYSPSSEQVTSATCEVVGTDHIIGQLPVPECIVTQDDESKQNVIQMNFIFPLDGHSIVAMHPAGSDFVVLDSNIVDLNMRAALYTNIFQNTLTGDNASDWLWKQDKPVPILTNDQHDAFIQAQGTQTIFPIVEMGAAYYVPMRDGTYVLLYDIMQQALQSSHVVVDYLDIRYITVDYPPEITSQFRVHSKATVTPTASIWETTVTPTPVFDNPIQATATIGPVIELGPDGQPTGQILAATVETPFPIENPQPPITGLVLDMSSLEGKIMVTHANEDTRNPIDSSAIDQALLQLDTANDPQTMIQLGETITAASGSHFDQWLANIRAGGKYQLHYSFLHEKVAAKDLGQIQIKAAYVDQNHLAHFVGHDSSGNWIFFNLTRSELNSIYKRHPNFAQTLTTTGTNTAVNEVVKTMLTQKVQVKRNAFIMPEQFVLAGSRADTWSSAWHAATAQGSVICYVTDTTPSPEYAILASCPVDTPIKPDGLYFDSFGSPYLIGTISDNTSGNYTVHSGQIVILDPRNLISDHDQPESEQFSWSAWWDKVTGK